MSSIARMPARTGTVARRWRPHLRRLPRRVRDEVLHGLVVEEIAQAAVHCLHRLPLAVVEQPVDVLRRGGSLRLPAEARAEPIKELAESLQQRTRRPRRHSRSVQNPPTKYKSSAVGHTVATRVNMTK